MNGDDGRSRTKAQRCPQITDGDSGVLLSQFEAQAQIGPEVIWMYELGTTQQRGRIPSALPQAVPQRGQHLGRGLRIQRRPGQFLQLCALPPRPGVADAVAPGVRVGPSRTFMIHSCWAESAVHAAQSSSAASSALHTGEALIRPATIAGLSTNGPSPASRNANS